MSQNETTNTPWRAFNSGTGPMRWFLSRRVGGRDEYLDTVNGCLHRFGSYESAQRKADALNATQLATNPTADLGDLLRPGAAAADGQCAVSPEQITTLAAKLRASDSPNAVAIGHIQAIVRPTSDLPADAQVTAVRDVLAALNLATSDTAQFGTEPEAGEQR